MRILTAVAALLMLGNGSLPPHGASSSPCLSADHASADLIFDVTRIVTGTDTSDARSRGQLHLPQVAANQVTLVTSDSICHAALLGLNVADTTAQAYVLHVGSGAYVVRFPPSLGGSVYFYTLDSTFVFQAIAVI